MFSRKFALLIAFALTLAACSGGETAGGPAASTLPNSTRQAASGTLTIGAPTAGAAANSRKAAFVSPSTTFATLWIDGNATANTRLACTPGGGTTGQCTLQWSSTSGSHTFVIAVDDSPTAAGGGNVLADISVVENLTSGVNSLANVTLNGVPAEINHISEGVFQNPQAQCQLIASPGNCVTGHMTIEDADANYIASPSNLDNGGICLQPTDQSVGVVDEADCYTATTGANQYFGVWCAVGANGTFTISAASAQQSGPFGAASAAQLATYSLVYPNQTALAVLNWPTYVCSNGQITAFGQATGPITVQSVPKKL
jgi:hypothetical protein